MIVGTFPGIVLCYISTQVATYNMTLISPNMPVLPVLPIPGQLTLWAVHYVAVYIIFKLEWN